MNSGDCEKLVYKVKTEAICFVVTIQLRDLTNVQFSIPNVHPMGHRLRILCRLLSPRMRIGHCELSIGQIYQNVLNSYVLFTVLVLMTGYWERGDW